MNDVIINPIIDGIRTNRFRVAILYMYIPYRLNRDKSMVDDIPGIIVDIDKSVPIRKYFISSIWV